MLYLLQHLRAIPAFGAGQNARSFFDLNIKYATENLFAKGLGYIAFTKDMVAKGPIAKFLSQDQIKSKEACLGLANFFKQKQ